MDPDILMLRILAFVVLVYLPSGMYVGIYEFQTGKIMYYKIAAYEIIHFIIVQLNMLPRYIVKQGVCF